eukprot:CAMPEP_0170487566 /NCGR_PEP_ID=MMETSP0208-20121228/6349_1 /TAXON_ID=197538 /ORGANISM="Strombidium inclinatum, Strain S3" /LENGTH=125 /DNA_ID=CAMNT_0010761891 /DNA_START=340 /DNA_END=718 /DNA_ORIENTATION=-
MGSVGSSSAGDSSLGAHVSDLALFDVEALGLSVGLEVLEQEGHVLDRFHRPSSGGGVLEMLEHGVSADSTSEPSEGDDGLVLENVVHVLDGGREEESLAGSGGFVRVLEMSSEVIDSAMAATEKG